MRSHALAQLAVLALALLPCRADRSPAGLKYRVPVGYSLDVFDRYGQLALLFKTLPLEQEPAQRAELERHLYLGTANSVFAPRSYHTETRLHDGAFRRQPRFDFCRSSHELLRALFADWQIEGTREPHKALIAGTPPKWIAERL
ncbi:uncharacterized protein LOC119091242, partial [Pollicipes pollicipes]|uniref:uncharacterized protein LOC119091242 n=1 Tax=Pollicipes pollicipes TaxID=41117 RepID=UPI001884EBB6